ncbi:hypothetical protein APS56_07580 [Pseudalgibacter alginicilyticus]|uniref:DUF3089 domain-containing protein n=1 Tax=Pseudalgibacter alginicilyticus TaxID=1736674 RepID=A0A0P0CWU7_9FLAO|nr:DUF3089 domain-containing protein [Pseudalgibacter alginicilyticus]ALJ04991.1 hypothetical protein APS56_07580 [Pseudalgibacter alginicilyticus]
MKELIFIFQIILILSCSKENGNITESDFNEETIEIPNSTVSYDDMENWSFHPNKATILHTYNLDIAVIDQNLEIEQIIDISNNSNANTGVDVFWVHPTILSDTQNFTAVEAIAIEDQDAIKIALTTIAQGSLLAKYGRMFAPRYRQSTGKAYNDNVEKELQANVIATSYSDIKAAFLNYLNNYNNGNKIILAGHSQGSFLLGMLLRDLFDTDENLRNKLVTAALGGMRYVYAKQGTYKGGWWENIPLCTAINECGCISNWNSMDEEQAISDINYGLPEFNPYLINSGLVYRAFDETQDWIIQDFSYYGETATSLKNYIAPDTSYNLADDSNFIAFNDLYLVRFKRENSQKIVLSVAYAPLQNDQRPNDLANAQSHPNYSNFGYHTKDYHIYLWALMDQIDQKLSNCE